MEQPYTNPQMPAPEKSDKSHAVLAISIIVLVIALIAALAFTFYKTNLLSRNDDMKPTGQEDQTDVSQNGSATTSYESSTEAAASLDQDLDRIDFNSLDQE